MVGSRKRKKSDGKITYTDVRKKIEKGVNAAIVSSIVMIIVGLLFIIFPVDFLHVIRWVIAIICFMISAAIIAFNFRSGFMLGGSVVAAITFVIGLLFATQPGIVNIFSIVLGIWFIITSLASSSMSAALRGSSAILSWALSFICLFCGIVMVINPWGTSISIMMFIGIVTIIHSISSLVDTLIMRAHLADLSKRFRSFVIEEGEIVETTPKK